MAYARIFAHIRDAYKYVISDALMVSLRLAMMYLKK